MTKFINEFAYLYRTKSVKIKLAINLYERILKLD
jgi:hypothetical protein